MQKIKQYVQAVFNSPYLDKADVAVAIAALVILFKLPLDPTQQAAFVTLIVSAYAVAHKLTNS